MHATRTRWAALATAAIFVTTFAGSLAIGSPSAYGDPTDGANSTVVASSPSEPADGTTATITVTLLDDNDDPVAGDDVSLSQGDTTSSISAESGSSAGDGTVTFTVSDTVAEDVTYTATDTTTNTPIDATATVDFTTGPTDAGTSTVSAAPTSVTADGVSTSTVMVTLLDANDNPVVGDTVALTPHGGSSAISDPSGPSAADGTVTFTVSDAVAQDVAYTARDTTVPVTIEEEAEVTFTNGPTDAGTSTDTANPTVVTANGTSISTITVTLRDANGNPVEGDDVTLDQGAGTSTISDPSGPSAADGTVTFTVTDGSVEDVTYTATDTTAAIVLAHAAVVDFTAGPTDPSTSTVSTSPPTVTANGTSTSTITVTLLDANFHPVQGDNVTLAAGSGSSAISLPSGPSAADGTVTFTVSDAAAQDVIYTATDTTVPVTIAEEGEVTFTPGPTDAGTSTVTADPTSVTANGTATSTVTVTLLDANGNPVVGDDVTLTPNSGSSTVSDTSGPSGTNGTVTFTVSDITAQTVVYSAEDATQTVPLSATAEVTFTAGRANDFRSTVTANPTPVTADGISTSTITVTLRDANGNPVAGDDVFLDQGSDSSDISAASGPSAANGTVTFTVSDTTAEDVTYTAIDDSAGAIINETAAVDFVAGPTDAGTSTVTADPTSVTADGTSTSTVTVTLRDANGNPVVGDDVTLTQGEGSSSAISDPSGPSAADGTVTFTVSDAVAEDVTYTATDTTVPVGINQTAEVTFTPGPTDAGTSTVTADPTSVTADGTSTSTVTVTLHDANGNPIVGDNVILSAGSGSSTMSVPSGPSAADGTVTFGVSDAVAEDVTYTATDTTAPVVIAETASVDYIAGPTDAATSTVSADPPSVTADGVSTSTITVTLLDANGNPVVGDNVTLDQGEGSASAISDPSGPSAADGTVTFTVTDAVAEVVIYSAEDTTELVDLNETPDVTFTSGPVSDGTSTVTSSPPAVTADGTSTSTVTVTLRDANGNPVAGDDVSLTQGEGSSSAISDPSGPSAADGTVTFTVSDAVAEDVTYTATDTTVPVGITETAAVDFTAGPTDATTSTVTADPTTVTANGTSTSTVTVTLRDANGNPVVGDDVTLTQGEGSSSAISDPSGPSAADGTVTFTVSDLVAEDVTYTATDTSVALGITGTAAVDFTAGPTDATTSNVTADPTSVTADGASTSTITVTLLDANNNPVVGDDVTLTPNGGSSAISDPSGPSDGRWHGHVHRDRHGGGERCVLGRGHHGGRPTGYGG